MVSSTRHIFTVEQIADRWRVEPAKVGDLIGTGALPRAILMTGPVRLLLREETGRPIRSPPLDTEGIHARLLISTGHIAPGQRCWPLNQVRRIYAFLDGDRLGRLSLHQYCAIDQVKRLGWEVEFELAQTRIEGQDVAWVELSDLVQYETARDIQTASREQQAEAARLRDRTKQRCRVAASIVWHTDPSMTLPTVYRHPWIQEHACEGRPPTEKTFREWVKDLNPDRKPGRRPRP